MYVGRTPGTQPASFSSSSLKFPLLTLESVHAATMCLQFPTTIPVLNLHPTEVLARTTMGWARWRGGRGAADAAMPLCSATRGHGAGGGGVPRQAGTTPPGWYPPAFGPPNPPRIATKTHPATERSTHPDCRCVPRREARSKDGRDGFGTEEEDEEEEDAVGKRGATTRPAGPAPAPAAAAGCKLPAWRWGRMGWGGGWGGRGWLLTCPERGNE